MTEYCSFCGLSNPPYDQHHIAGYINNPLWTVKVCKPKCHNILSAWQWARRTPMRKENEPPDEVKIQAMYDGLSAAYTLASEYAGHTAASMAAQSIITKLLHHDSDPMKGVTFSDSDNTYPKLNAKLSVRAGSGQMTGENFLRVAASMCDMMASLAEMSEGKWSLATMLRQIAESLPYRWPVDLPKAEFLAALGTADEVIIRERLGKFAAEIGIEL